MLGGEVVGALAVEGKRRGGQMKEGSGGSDDKARDGEASDRLEVVALPEALLERGRERREVLVPRLAEHRLERREDLRRGMGGRLARQVEAGDAKVPKGRTLAKVALSSCDGVVHLQMALHR